MSLGNIQLCHVDPVGGGKYEVTVHSDDATMQAEFVCDNERDAIKLRNAIRDYAVRLRAVHDYR